MANEIDDLDYNTLRNKIIEVLGTGAGTFGYGQSLQSLPVFQGNIITKQQFDNLRFDIINILIHQTGVTPSITEIAKGDVIGRDAGDPLSQYDRLITEARNNRFLLAPGQSTVTAVSTKTYTSAWSSLASMTAQLTFASSDAARYFFNSGGKIRLTSTRTGGTSSAQNNAWSDVLSASGTVEFTGDPSGAILSFYQLTNSYQILFQRSLSTAYSSNLYNIEVLSNVADNAAGTATSLTFRIQWIDNYTDPFPTEAPPDSVDGTLSLVIEEVKASGSLQPSGSFAITSPSYSISNISAS